MADEGDELPGRPQAIEIPGHTRGTVAYRSPALGMLFTGDALVTQKNMTGHTSPCLVSRSFTHDSAAALASLDLLAELPPTALLPGQRPGLHVRTTGRPRRGPSHRAALSSRQVPDAEGR